MTSTSSCCSALERWLSPGLFRALSDPTRLAILVALSDGGRERAVSEIACCCPVDLSVVSRHLRVLRDAGIVEARKQGKEVLYRVQCDAVVTMLRNLADALERCCPPAQSRAPNGGSAARAGRPRATRV